MNSKFLLLISFFNAFATTKISYIIAPPQKVKSQSDFVSSDLSVENTKSLIFITGLIVSGVFTLLSLNLKTKKDLFLLPICFGLILVVGFNNEDHNLLPWVGATLFFVGFQLLIYFLKRKTRILKALPITNIILFIMIWLKFLPINL